MKKSDKSFQSNAGGRRASYAAPDKSRRLLAVPAAIFLVGLLFYSANFASPMQEYLLVGVSAAAAVLLFGFSRDYMACALSQAFFVFFALSYYIFKVFAEKRPVSSVLTFIGAFDIGLVWFAGFLITVLIRLFSFGSWDTKKRRAGFRRAFHLSSIVFLLAYCGLLVWLFGTLRTMDLDGERSLNLIPLQGAFSIYWPHILAGEFKYGIFIQFFGNLFIFTPLGFYLSVYGRRIPKTAVFFVPILLSGAIETTQYIFNMGKSDIDDFWMNVLGFWMGVFLYYLIGWIRRLVTRGEEKNIC